VAGMIDLPAGTWPGTTIEGAVVVLRHGWQGQKLVGVLRDVETAASMAIAFGKGPSRKTSPNWVWLDGDDPSGFAEIERQRSLRKLMPRGRHKPRTLASLLISEKIKKADKPVQDGEEASFLYVPEYANCRVTADLDSQTVKPNAVYRLPIDPAQVNPRFLALLLNSAYGKALRQSVARGATIQRVSIPDLLALNIPIPDAPTQNRIARIDGDVDILKAALGECVSATEGDWSAIDEVAETVEQLKAVLDIERRIADWWRELPYPMATIYRLYQVSTDPKARLDTFFEMTAVYLSAVGVSHIMALRGDYQPVLEKLLHPQGAQGIERADFGFWIKLAQASFKELNRITGDIELRTKAGEIGGPELLRTAETIAPLGAATEALVKPLRCRNSWKGHGGHIKPSDAVRLVAELQQDVRDLFESTSSIFRRFQLVRPGKAEFGQAYRYDFERLMGSDPAFENGLAELDRPATSNELAFWLQDSRTMCRAVHFFRLGAPQHMQETSVYVFNRVDDRGFRWISYQESREQEIFAPDDELRSFVESRPKGA